MGVDAAVGNAGPQDFMPLSFGERFSKEVDHATGNCSVCFLSTCQTPSHKLWRALRKFKGANFDRLSRLVGKIRCVEQIAFRISQRDFVLLLFPPQDCELYVNASVSNGVLCVPLNPVFSQHCACPWPSACVLWTAWLFLWGCCVACYILENRYKILFPIFK